MVKLVDVFTEDNPVKLPSLVEFVESNCSGLFDDHGDLLDRSVKENIRRFSARADCDFILEKR